MTATVWRARNPVSAYVTSLSKPWSNTPDLHRLTKTSYGRSPRALFRAAPELLHLVHSRPQLLPRQLVVWHLHGPQYRHQLGRPCPTRLWLDDHHSRRRRHRSVTVRAGFVNAPCRGAVLLDCHALAAALRTRRFISDGMDCLGRIAVHVRQYRAWRGQSVSWVHQDGPS